MENRNLYRELELECLDYRIDLANKFSDIENENDRFAALKNLYYFMDNFDSEIANLDEKNFGEVVSCYKQFSMGQNLDEISFKDCNNNQKLAAIMSMRVNDLKCDKETFKKWVNDNKNGFDAELKAIAFYSLFDIKEWDDDWTLQDLEEIGIADWPEKIKYNLIKNLVYENYFENNNLSDVKYHYDLENNTFFKNAIPEIKRLLMLKMFSNINKDNNGWNLLYSSLDDINKYQLKIDLYNNYGLNLKLINDKQYPISKNTNKLYFSVLKMDHDYENMPGDKKLMALLQCSGKIAVDLEIFDEIIKKMDLKSFMVTKELLPQFFERYQEFNPDILTPELILKKNWPFEIKKAAFSTLPVFYKTERNRKIIFDQMEISSSIDKAKSDYDLNSIKTKMINYMNMLLPDFEKNIDNQNPKIEMLKKKINNINDLNDKKKQSLKDLLNKIYDTTKEVTFTYADKLNKRLEEYIGDNKEKDTQLMNYIIGEENKVPDFIKADHDLYVFIEYSRRTILEHNKKEQNFNQALPNGIRIAWAVTGIIWIFSAFGGATAAMIILAPAAAKAFGFLVCVSALASAIPALAIGVAATVGVTIVWLLSKAVCAIIPDGKAVKEAKKLASKIKNTVNEEKNKNPQVKQKVDDLEKKFNDLHIKIKDSNVIQNGHQQELSKFLGFEYNENVYEINKLQKEKRKLVTKKDRLENKIKTLLNKHKDEQYFVMPIDLDTLEKLKEELVKIKEEIKFKDDKIENFKYVIKESKKNKFNLPDGENKSQNNVDLKLDVKPLSELKVINAINKNKINKKDAAENKINRSKTQKNKQIQDL